MKDTLHHDPLDALGQAYEKMYERFAEDFHHAEKKTSPLFHKLIGEAKEKAIELEEISKDDAEKVAHWVKRDLAAAANYLSKSEHELKDWLGFETSLLERKALDMLLNVADKTNVKLMQMKEDAIQASSYHTGEVIGPGTLVCDQCEEQLHFHKVSKIPPCPKCHTTVFHRNVRVKAGETVE